MPAAIYDFDALRAAANLLEGADQHQPMAVKTEPAQAVADYSYMYVTPIEDEPVVVASDFDYGC